MKLSQYLLIGRYISGNTYIHKLDPRAKLIFVFIYIIMIFANYDLKSYLILLTIAMSGVLFSGISFKYYLKGIIPILWIIIFTALIHLTTTNQGELILDIGLINIYSEGVEQAVLISLRLILIVLISSILTLTTSPLDLTSGLERLLSPLKYLKVPIRELALMMTISLRFIPILVEEAEKVIKAQKARGADLDRGSVKQRISAIVASIVPMFINVFKRADDLSIALEARGYNGNARRTRLNASDFTWRDYLLFLIIIILIIFFKRS